MVHSVSRTAPKNTVPTTYMRSSPVPVDPAHFRRNGVATALTANAQASIAALKREGEIFECMACHARAITKHPLMQMIGMDNGDIYTN